MAWLQEQSEDFTSFSSPFIPFFFIRNISIQSHQHDQWGQLLLDCLVPASVRIASLLMRNRTQGKNDLGEHWNTPQLFVGRLYTLGIVMHSQLSPGIQCIWQSYMPFFSPGYYQPRRKYLGLSWWLGW